MLPRRGMEANAVRPLSFALEIVTFAESAVRPTMPPGLWPASHSRRVLLHLLRNRLELGQPDIGAAIGGRAPVATRRQRAAGRDLGSVGQRRALELVGEKPPQEQFQPVPDLAKLVGAPRPCRQVGGPGTLVDVVPGVPGEEGDLGRAEAEPRQVEQIEVLQRVRPDRLLGRLDGAGCTRRNEFR